MEDQNEGVPPNATARRTLADYVKPSLEGALPSVIRPTVQVKNFTIPPQIVTMIQNSVQFEGLPEEDPHAHVALFLEVCDTFKIDGVSDDVIKLRLFPFSLKGRAKSWLNSLPRGSITTWEDMATKFMFRYLPPSKTAQLRNNIYGFIQDDGESLYEAWESFKELLRKCPHHGLELWQQVQTFYNGLNTMTRQTVDIMAGGSFSTKTPEETFNLFEELAMKNYQWPTTRSRASTYRLGVHQVDSNTTLVAQVEALSSKIDRLQMNTFQGCEVRVGANVNAHHQHGVTFNSHEQVDGAKDVIINTGNPSNIKEKSNPDNYNTSRLNEHKKLPSQQESIFYDKKTDNIAQLEKKLMEMMSRFLDLNQSYHKENQDLFEKHRMEIESQKNVIENIEEHLRDITTSLTKHKRDSLLKIMNKHRNKQVKELTISRRFDKVDKPTITSEPASEEKEIESPSKMPNTRLSPTSTTRPKETVEVYNPPLLFLARLENDISEEQNEKFLEPYKQLHINLPCVEVLAKMPKYAIFLKDMLTNKKKLEEISMVTMNEVCSAVLQNKLPQKKTDPGSFTIPCLIGSLSVKNALADLGASINLMPYSVFTKLDLGEPMPTHMIIQLADRSLKYPRGVMENMLLKIDGFVFPVDFVILDMVEDENVPLILGSPFLGTSRALIDVFDGKLTLRLDDETITFEIKNSMKHTKGHANFIYFIGTIMSLVGSCFRKIHRKHTMDTQILGRLKQKLEGSANVIEQETSPLARESPPGPMVFKVNERQDPKANFSVVESSSLVRKKLPCHMEYVLVDNDPKLPLIIAKDLMVDESEKLLMMLVTPQRRVNPNLQVVIKMEVSKMLDVGLINFISIHAWVSPIHVVPEKGGMSSITNKKTNLIPTQGV